jgi:hypothetical protein
MAIDTCFLEHPQTTSPKQRIRTICLQKAHGLAQPAGWPATSGYSTRVRLGRWLLGSIMHTAIQRQPIEHTAGRLNLLA